MASRATRNAIATLAMAQAVAHTVQGAYKDHPRGKTSLIFAGLVELKCQRAIKLWPPLDVRSSLKVLDRIRRMANGNLSDAQTLPVYTSFALGLLEDLACHLSGQKEKAVLDAHAALKRMHRHFDRTGKKFADYDKAASIVEAWEKLSE